MNAERRDFTPHVGCNYCRRMQPVASISVTRTRHGVVRYICNQCRKAREDAQAARDAAAAARGQADQGSAE